MANANQKVVKPAASAQPAGAPGADMATGEKKSKLWLWILIAVVVIAIGVGIYFALK